MVSWLKNPYINHFAWFTLLSWDFTNEPNLLSETITLEKNEIILFDDQNQNLTNLILEKEETKKEDDEIIEEQLLFCCRLIRNYKIVVNERWGALKNKTLQNLYQINDCDSVVCPKLCKSSKWC